MTIRFINKNIIPKKVVIMNFRKTIPKMIFMFHSKIKMMKDIYKMA